MDEKQTQALALKYQGKTYDEMSKETEVPVGTLKGWFEYDGLLFWQYRLYEEKRNNEKEQAAKASLKKHLDIAVQVLINALAAELKKIKKLEEEKKEANYSTAVQLAEKIMDRTGMSVVSKQELSVELSKKVQSYAEFIEGLRVEGIDIETGISERAIQVGESQQT